MISQRYPLLSNSPLSCPLTWFRVFDSKNVLFSARSSHQRTLTIITSCPLIALPIPNCTIYFMARRPAEKVIVVFCSDPVEVEKPLYVFLLLMNTILTIVK